MKTLLIIFSLVLLLLLVGLWSGPGSYPDRWRLDDLTMIQEQENSDKLKKIEKIQAELQDVTSSKDALEERARSELGMTKKDETFFEVIMQAEDKPRQNVASGLGDSDGINGSVNKNSVNNSAVINSTINNEPTNTQPE